MVLLLPLGPLSRREEGSSVFKHLQPFCLFSPLKNHGAMELPFAFGCGLDVVRRESKPCCPLGPAD